MKLLALEFPTGEIVDEADPEIFTPRQPSATNWRFSSETKPIDIINLLLPYIFVIAGLILFAILIAGGFTIFLSTGNPDKIKKGTGMIVNALVGYIIIFAAYWIIQIIQTITGLNLL